MTTPVLVTGATGFVGSAVLDRLGPGAVGIGRAELQDPDLLAATLADAPVWDVVHAAGGAAPGSPVEVHERNVVPLLRLLDAAGARLRRVVLVSSVAVYGLTRSGPTGTVDPDTAYGRAKWMAEEMLRLAARDIGLTPVVVRCASVYGPGNHSGNAANALTRAAAEGHPFVVHQPAAARDYVYVDDVADALARCLTAGVAAVVDLGSGTASTPADLADAARRAGIPVEVIRQPAPEGTARATWAAPPDPFWEAVGRGPATPLPVGLRHEVAWRRAEAA